MPNGDTQQSIRAPRPEPERISALIKRIDEGDVKLPTFQRPQVWNVGQAIDLLDSVNRGYPVGSLLFWLTRANRQLNQSHSREAARYTKDLKYTAFRS
jgi:hypothetical protein